MSDSDSDEDKNVSMGMKVCEQRPNTNVLAADTHRRVWQSVDQLTRRVETLQNRMSMLCGKRKGKSEDNDDDLDLVGKKISAMGPKPGDDSTDEKDIDTEQPPEYELMNTLISSFFNVLNINLQLIGMKLTLPVPELPVISGEMQMLDSFTRLKPFINEWGKIQSNNLEPFTLLIIDLSWTAKNKGHKFLHDVLTHWVKTVFIPAIDLVQTNLDPFVTDADKMLPSFINAANNYCKMVDAQKKLQVLLAVAMADMNISDVNPYYVELQQTVQRDESKKRDLWRHLMVLREEIYDQER